MLQMPAQLNSFHNCYERGTTNVKRTFVPTLLFPWVCIPSREMVLWEKLLGEVGFLIF